MHVSLLMQPMHKHFSSFSVTYRLQTKGCARLQFHKMSHLFYLFMLSFVGTCTAYQVTLHMKLPVTAAGAVLPDWLVFVPVGLLLSLISRVNMILANLWRKSSATIQRSSGCKCLGMEGSQACQHTWSLQCILGLLAFSFRCERSWTTELHTLPVHPKPDTLLRKLISAACMHETHSFS